MFAARKLLNFHAASQRRIKALCVVGASVDRPRTVVQNGKVSSAGARPVNWPAHHVQLCADARCSHSKDVVWCFPLPC